MKFGLTSRRILFLAAWMALAGCAPRNRTIQGSDRLAEFKAELKKTSDRQADELSDADRAGPIPQRTIAIIGDGIAGAAAARNIDEPVRVYGSTSFWGRMQGLPEVWQTDLAAAFTGAKLDDPKMYDPVDRGDRIAREAVIAVYLHGLVEAKAEYLQTGPVSLKEDASGNWKMVDSDGRVELVTQALIVGTGVLRPLQITDLVPDPAVEMAREDLEADGKIETGDEYLGTPSPAPHAEIGILGAGGSSADCIIHAIEDGKANEVVVWGGVPPPLIPTKAYQDMLKQYGNRICRVNANVKAIGYGSGQITVNGTATPTCVLESDHSSKTAGPLELLIESLGRYQGDPPAIVTEAADGRAIEYHPVIEDGKLIAIRVLFEDAGGGATSKPLFLIGAAATWIPQGVHISLEDRAACVAALNETVNTVNSSAEAENAPPGFAVAAYMGSHLAKACFPHGSLVHAPPCQ